MLNARDMLVELEPVALSPRMAVTVEIKTGAQRVITTCCRRGSASGTTACTSAEPRNPPYRAFCHLAICSRLSV